MADVTQSDIPIDYASERSKINNAWNNSLNIYEGQRKNMLGQYGFDQNTSFGGKSLQELMLGGGGVDAALQQGLKVGSNPFGQYQQMINQEGMNKQSLLNNNQQSGVGEFGIGADRLNQLQNQQAGERQGFVTDAFNNLSNLYNTVSGGYGDEQGALKDLQFQQSQDDAARLAQEASVAPNGLPPNTPNTTAKPPIPVDTHKLNQGLNDQLSGLLKPDLSGKVNKGQLRNQLTAYLRSNAAHLDPKQVAKANAILKFYDKNKWDTGQISNQINNSIKILQKNMADKTGKIDKKWVDKHLNSYMLNFGDFLDPKTKLRVKQVLAHYKKHIK